MLILRETTWPYFIEEPTPKTSERPRLNLEIVSNDKTDRYGSQMPKFTSRLFQSSAKGKGLLALYTVCILAHYKWCVYWHWGLHSEARHRIDTSEKCEAPGEQCLLLIIFKSHFFPPFEFFH